MRVEKLSPDKMSQKVSPTCPMSTAIYQKIIVMFEKILK